ncbi:MAG: single-stranded DNA-binding protein [Puniceicoccales bacterium]|jgi:single-strand DNA-binding protein|nr:single-stranded DNA-binding protein [Puniceicoccales bacterium]
MSSFNKVILLGNLTRDPEMRTTNSGLAICKLGVATTRVSRGSDGESHEETVFVDVDAFGKQAEVIGRYFTKGRPIFIEGRLRLDQWETSAGEKRSKLCIVLESFQFISSARFDDGNNETDFTASAPIPATLKKNETEMVSPANGGLDEDVPF